MTITDALAQLSKAWPEVSFLISLDVWSHVHDDGRQIPEVEWEIYNATDRIPHYHPTLSGAVALALRQLLRPASLLQSAEASLEDMP